MLKLDHMILAVNNLDQAVESYRALGFTVIYGGKHANNATHNALICFRDGSYLELMALTGESVVPDIIDFGHLLMGGEGIVGYALLVDDLSAHAERLRAAGLTIRDHTAGERLRADGQQVAWTLLTTEEYGFAPLLLQDVTPHNLRVPDDRDTTHHDNTAYGLAGVTLISADPEADAARLALILGIEANGDHTFTLADGVLITLKHYPNADAARLESITLRCIDHLLDERTEVHNAVLQPLYPA